MNASEIEKRTNNVAAWIPQLFYDIIARIIPGFCVLLMILLSILDFDQFYYYFKKMVFVDSSVNLSVNLLILLSIGLSYIIAIIIRALGCMVLHPFYKKDKANFDVESEAESDQISFSYCNSIYKTNDIALRYDFIKLNDVINGNRITKLKAEVQMSGIMFIGFAIASLISMGMFFTDFSNSRLIISFTTLLLCFFCFKAKTHFNNRLKMAVINCSELLGFSKIRKELYNLASLKG